MRPSRPSGCGSRRPHAAPDAGEISGPQKKDSEPFRIEASYRAVATDPTLLLDEVDALFKSHSDRTEPLRGLLNAASARRVGSWTRTSRNTTRTSFPHGLSHGQESALYAGP